MKGESNIMRRYFTIIILMAFVGISIIVKAAFVMFGERQYWKDVSERFIKENVIVKPNRGNILSADGQLMASSLPEYKIYMDFKAGGAEKDSLLMANLDSICDGLHNIFPDKSAADFKSLIKKGRNKGSRNWELYPKRISYIQCKEVKRLPVFNLNKYKGGFIDLTFNQRKKPFGSLAMRTLGDVFAAKDSAKNGLELGFDTILKGKDGITHRQKVMNKYLNITDIPPVDGCDIVSTIDVGMQDICEKALVDELKEINATVGVAILMEVATGDVKAIVNMTKCGDGNYYEIKNNAVSDMMEPGSTFKTASIMVGIDDGYININDSVDTGCGIYNMYGRPMKDHNWHRGGYGWLTVPKVLMFSSNVGVSRLIDEHYHNNPGKYVEGLYRIGIASDLRLPIPGYAKPWIRRPNKENWSKTALAWMSIGYETQVPPISTLCFYNAIANGGKMIRPKFVKSVVKNGEIIREYPTETIKESICSPSTLKKIQDILELVVSKGLGKKAGNKTFHVSGKTGTAQVSQGKGGYKTGTTHYMVSFCGYFPSESPKYSCIVAIQKSGLPASGGLMAGSVFGKIAERVYARNLALDVKDARDSASVMIPDVKNGDLKQAQAVLSGLSIPFIWKKTMDYKGMFDWGYTHRSNVSVNLIKQGLQKNIIPDVIGMGAKDAVYALEKIGLKVTLVGIGKVESQSIPHGTRAIKGQTIKISLK